MGYLELSGILFNVMMAACLLCLCWSVFIFPAIEAVSQCRWYAEIGKYYPSVKPTKGWLILWWSCFEIGGRSYDATSNKYGRWSGVGRWTVNKDETQQ